MAADLELEPKPYHMIGFEDTNDCKSLCYIIQAQMEMLGNGHTFVVPQPPKDVFRDAKANDFGVTVMRKGELQLHMDQTLEEVEKQITEIRSKIYHDKIMQERSIDYSSIVDSASVPSCTSQDHYHKISRMLRTTNEVISLALNSLSGVINNGIVNLTNLTILDLHYNQFSGVLPLHLGKLSKLKHILLDFNYFEGSLPL